MFIGEMQEKDNEAYKGLFDEAYSECLEFLKKENLQQYLKERKERREVSQAHFAFYFKTGSSFVAEKEARS